MRESVIIKIHYATALAAVAFVALHILIRLMQGFASSLEYESVVANYQFLPYAGVLEAILVLLSIHGFNGLRVVLLELRQGRTYERSVTVMCIVFMVAVIAYGSRTIFAMNMGAF